MHDVQLKLAYHRVSKYARVPFCHLDTDKNLTVLKRYHVSRTRLPEKLPMQPRHPAIGNEADENFLQPPQVRPVLAPNVYAKAYRALSELLKIADVHGHNPLKIANADSGAFCEIGNWQLAMHHAGGLCSDRKLRVIKRAPLSKVRYAHAH